MPIVYWTLYTYHPRRWSLLYPALTLLQQLVPMASVPMFSNPALPFAFLFPAIFCLSFSFYHLSLAWKSENITPVSTNGAKTDAVNVRPVSLLTIPAKFCNVTSFLVSNSLFSNHHFIFCPGHLTLNMMLLLCLYRFNLKNRQFSSDWLEKLNSNFIVHFWIGKQAILGIKRSKVNSRSNF